jgi:hypothetical protein
MLVKIRNNSQSVRGFPAIGNAAGTVKGPRDAITILPGATAEIDSERLKMYESKAFMAAFVDKGDGRRPDLEILRPDAPVLTMKDVLAAYDKDAASKPPPSNPVANTLDAKVTPHVPVPRAGQAQTGNVPGDAPISAIDVANGAAPKQ